MKARKSCQLLAACLGLVSVTLLVYLPVLNHGFVVFDDDDYLTSNRIVQNGLTWTGVKWAFTTWHANNWHPLTWLSHMLDCQLFGLQAGAHHLVSVLLHCTNSLLILLLWRRLTGSLWASALAAALFAWHPLHVESVAWAAERKDVLSTLFFLLALWAYAHYAQSKVTSLASEVTEESQVPGVECQAPKPEKGEPRFGFHVPRVTLFYLLSLLFFACGLMSKPMLVTIPFVLLLLDYWPLRRVSRAGFNVRRSDNLKLKTAASLVLEKIPFLALSAASCVVTYLSQGTTVATLGEHSLGLRLGNAIIAYGRYLLKTVWPADLAVIYPAVERLQLGGLLAAATVLAASSALAWAGRRRAPYLLTGWLWFLGTLVPVIGLVQVGQQAMADRYTYIPLIGLFIAASFAAQDLARLLQLSWPGVAVATGCILLSLLVATRLQLRTWRTSETLFAHAVAVTKDNAIAQINLGAALLEQGRTHEALIHYREGLRIAEAHPHTSDTLVTPAGKAVAYSNLAGRFERAGYAEEAAALYRQALGFDPGRADLHEHLGGLLVSLDRTGEGMQELAEAARLKPEDPRPHYLMGTVSFLNGQTSEAIAHFRDALRLNADDVNSLCVLAQVLACDADPHVRNGTEAVALAERANRLTDGRDPRALDTLAIACAETGRFDEAQLLTRKAIDLAGTKDLKRLVPAMEDRLRRYALGQPYRQALTNPPAARAP